MSLLRQLKPTSEVLLAFETHSGTGTHGHHEWQIEVTSLDLKYAILADARPLQLRNFVRFDIGSIVAFEVDDRYFYALSNQTCFDVEGADWTSFHAEIV